MSRLRNLEEFIVSIEDSTTLLKLYMQRLARSPGNAGYSRALASHAAEIKSAAEVLDINITHELASLPQQVAIAIVSYVEYLVDLSHLIDELATRLAAGQVLVVMQAIDMLRNGVAALEKLIYYLARTELSDLSDVAHTIKTFKNLLYAEPIGPDIAGGLEELADEVLTQPESEPELVFEEEDPFDEIDFDVEFIDDIVSNFESALDSVVQPDASVTAAASGEAEYYLEHDADQLQDLFANIASSYVQPVKGFIVELRDGHASKEWIDICRPALQSISRAANSMNYQSLCMQLERFDELLQSVAKSDSRLITGNNKREILERYSELEAAMPQAFSLDEDIVSELSKREGIIINSLLKQVKGVGATTIRKLFAAGMTSLDSYYLAKKEDLVAVSGIRPWLAERICVRFRAYKEELAASGSADARASQRQKLVDLIEELKRRQFLFRKATLEDWYANEESEEKKQSRKLRQQAMWQVNLTLAEIGSKEAMTLIKDLKKQVFERRIETLQEFIEQFEKNI